MSENMIAIVVRFDIGINDDFNSGIKRFDKYLGKNEFYDEDDLNVEWDNEKYHPVYRNDKWCLDVILFNDEEYDFDYEIIDLGDLLKIRSEVNRFFNHELSFKGTRIGFCHWYNGSDNPLDVEKW